MRRNWATLRLTRLVVAVALACAGCADAAFAQTDPIAAESLSEGRASLQAGDFQRAQAFFAKAAQAGSVEALELLGLAFERGGHLVQAKGSYQNYLKARSEGSDADRVRQRLSGVEAALESEAQAEFAARKKIKLEGAGTQRAPRAPIPRTISRSEKGNLGEPLWSWETSGSVGQSYYRSDGFAGSGLLRGSLVDHVRAEDDLVTTGDIRLNGSDGQSTITARVSANDRHGIATSGDERTRVSAAYVEMRDRLSGVSARVGRQSRYVGGVFGRFDGGLFGIQATDQILLQAVSGSPVYYGEEQPFADGRYFVGASVDVSTADKLWTGTLYALEQDVRSTVDRRALGGELRYNGASVQGYGGIDYDIFYRELNAAYASVAWQPQEAWSVYGTLDYRRVPFLLTSNALLGQPVDSLSELFDLFGTSESQALAVDRTATAATATVGVSYALTGQWQVSFDATVANYSGTPASGGVDEVPDPGTEYYLSARLDGEGIFKDGDYAGLGLSIVDSDLYRSYIGDLSLRYPLNDEWRLSPRLRMVYRDATDDGGHSILLMPSLGASYRISEHWTLESEAAVLWERNHGAGGTTSETEFRAMVGYRYSF